MNHFKMFRRWVLAAFTGKIRRFGAAQDAVAVVEFALTVPLLLLLYVGSTELSLAITADRRVTLIAGTMGDLVAQTKSELSSTDLSNFFKAANNIIQPYPAASLKQTVSCLFVNAQGAVTVEWSVGYNGATPRVKNSTYNLPVSTVAISKGSYVILAEASYTYTPMLDYVFKGPVTLYHENFYAPRYGGIITITP